MFLILLCSNPCLWAQTATEHLDEALRLYKADHRQTGWFTPH